MVLFQVKGPPLPPPQAPVPVKTPPPSGNTTHTISNADFLDRIGAGTFADLAVMTVLSIILGVILLGVVLWAFRKAFGSADQMREKFNSAEKILFDLMTRKASGEAKVAGLERQIAAVESSMRK